MTNQEFTTTDVLRLEVETDPTGLVNMIQNPNGELGSWGWVTPVANTNLTAANVVSFGASLTFATTVSQACYVRTELMPLAAGQYVAARGIVDNSSSSSPKVRFEFYNSSKTLLSSSTQSPVLGVSSTPWNLAPAVAPASTAYVALRFDAYNSAGTGNPPANSSFSFQKVTVAKAATSAELGTFRTNLAPNPSFETNLSGWNSYWYSGRETVLSQSSAASFSGTKCMAMVRLTSTGTMGFSSAPIPVTGGSDYVASFYMMAAATGRAFAPNIAWYNSAGTNVANTATSATTTSTSWGRLSVTGTAPASAAFMRVECSAASVPAGETHYVDAVLVEAGTSVGSYFDGSTAAAGGFTYAWTSGKSRLNLVTNPSAETNATGWTAQAGATVARVTSPAGASGSACLALTKTGSAGQADLYGSNPNRYVPTSWTEEITVTASVRAATTGRQVLLGYALYDSGGTLLSSSSYGLGFDASGSWNAYSARLKIDRSSTPTAAYVAPTVSFYNAAVGEVHYVDAVSLERTFTNGGGGSAFDGSTTASGGFSYSWSGTAHASTSTETGYLSSTATNSNLSYLPPVQYLDILGSAYKVELTRDPLSSAILTARLNDVALDPASSALVRPGRRVRLSTSVDGGSTWDQLFAGKLGAGSTVYTKDKAPGGLLHVDITLQATDATATLAAQGESRGVGSIDELPYILEGKGVPWNVNGSGNQVPSATVVASNDNAGVLDQVAITRDSVSGYAWINRYGVLNAWDAAEMPTSVAATFGDGPGDSPSYSGISVDYSTAKCINVVNVKWLRYNPATGDTTEVTYGPYVDQSSIDEWGANSADFTIQGASENPTTIADYAAAVLAANATPTRACNSLVMPVRDLAEVGYATQLDLYDKVHVDYSGAIDSDYRITGINHVITPDKWMVTYEFDETTSVAQPVATPSPPAPGSAAADGTWLTPTLLNSWENYPGYVPARYMRLGGVVYAQAMLRFGTTGANVVLFNLPAGYRPAYQLMTAGVTQQSGPTGSASAGTAHTHSISQTNGHCRIDVTTSGNVILNGEASSSGWVGFTVAFPAEG